MTVEIKADFRGGVIELFRDGKRVSDIYFLIERNQIYVEDVDTLSNYRRLGYASMCMEVLQEYARKYSRPIILFALSEAMPFYKKMGFHRIRKWKDGWFNSKRVVIDNFNPWKKYKEQVHFNDLVWIPPKLVVAHITLH